MEAIILAGGLGTRLRPAVPAVPKPMAPVNGRPFLEYQMEYWIGQGVRRFVLAVGHRHEIIERHFGVEWRGAAIAYTVESEPLGTGGGLLLAVGEMRAPGPWLVLNGDTFFEVGLPPLAAFHRENQSEITLSLFPIGDNTRYTGVEMDREHRITKLKSDAGEQFINGGVYLFGETALAGLPHRAGERVSLEEDILGGALQAGRRVYGHVSGGKFIDIGVPEDYARAQRLLG